MDNLKRSSASTEFQASSSQNQTIPITSSSNLSLEQDRLDLERQKQQRMEDKIRTEAEAVKKDTLRFAVKFPPMAESWTLEDNLKIEMAMKEVTAGKSRWVG